MGAVVHPRACREWALLLCPVSVGGQDPSAMGAKQEPVCLSGLLWACDHMSTRSGKPPGRRGVTREGDRPACSPA